MRLFRLLFGFLPISVFCQTTGDCLPTNDHVDIDINNIRFRVNQGGDLWWDYLSSSYEIPKDSGIHSVFAGGLWLAGMDQTGGLHAATTTYRQTGVDYYAGPMDTLNMTASINQCITNDQVFKLYRNEVEEFKVRFADPNYTAPYSILNYPANGNSDNNEAHQLAPFVDLNGNGIYEPSNGEYPKFADGCESGLKGDVCALMIFNDVGNVHTESNWDQAMGVEVHLMVYAFYSDNEHINNTSFYEYAIINRSNNHYSNFYAAKFIDVDLGYYGDDFVGCDVQRGLAFQYNGDSIDNATSNAYGEIPPAIGWDFIDGPNGDNDGIDNNFNGTVDEFGEKMQMSMFRDARSSFSNEGFPSDMPEHYEYIQGLFKDGSPMYYGGNGGAFYATHPNLHYKFNYPGESDTVTLDSVGNQLPAWTEELTGNIPADRRIMTSIGPFELNSYDTLKFTGALIWARASSGNHLSSVELLKEASDEIQSFHESCYPVDCRGMLGEFGVRQEENEINPYYYGDYDSIHWDFGDGSFSGLDYPNHIYELDGNYNLCVSAFGDCGDTTLCQTIFVNNSDYCGPEITRLSGTGSGTKFTELSLSMYGLFQVSNEVEELTYKNGKGPFKIMVNNEASLVPGSYVLEFLGYGSDAHWTVTNLDNNVSYESNSTIGDGEIEEVTPFGFSVYIQQSNMPGEINEETVVGGKIAFQGEEWLTFIKDTDLARADNWIRSGTVSDAQLMDNIIDSEEVYENVLEGSFAPYALVSKGENGVAWDSFQNLNKLDSLNNIDIVFTSNQDMWTRSVVVELADDINAIPTGFQNEKFHIKRVPSVDKNGNPDNSQTYGLGWFPGYAIDVNTGERLNIIFGEDGTLPNGNDLIWNPTSEVFDNNENPVFGGKHYIYVMAASSQVSAKYDEGASIHSLLTNSGDYSCTTSGKRNVYANIGWVGLPVLKEGNSLLENDLLIQLRVSQPYAEYATSQSNSSNGFYSFSFEDDFDCSTVSITENAPEESMFYLYPNPTTGIFHLLGTSGMNHYEIYGINGELIQVGQIKGNTQEINVDLPSAIYIIRLIGENQVMTSRFIVEN